MTILDGGTPWGFPATPPPDILTPFVFPGPSPAAATYSAFLLIAQQLQDITGQKWTTAVILKYFNLSIKEVVNLKPDAYHSTGTLILDGGPRQDIPSGFSKVLDIVGNIGPDEIVLGSSVVSLSKDRMDSIFPGWMQFTPTAPLTLPTAPTGTPSTSGGNMPDGTYYYVITAVNTAGETVKGGQSAVVTITGGGGNGSVALSWAAVPGAVSYKVFRTTAPGSYVTPVLVGNPATNSYTDTVASASTGAPPTGLSSLTGVSFVAIDERNPTVYYVYPAPTAPGIQLLQAILASVPADLTADTDAFPLDDSLIPAVVDYCIYRALAEETTIPNALNKANMFFNKFLQDLGLKAQEEKKSEGKQ